MMSHLLTRRATLAGLAAAFAVPARARDDAKIAALYEAAKKEGKVVYFTSNDVEVSQASAVEFAKKFPGIAIEAYKIEPGPAMERIIAESAAGRLSCDVTDGPIAYAQLLLDRDLALPYEWPGVFGIDAGDSLFGNRVLYAYNLDTAICYNTDLAKAADIPSWDSLGDTKWRGKILLESRGIVFPVLFVAWGEARAFDLLAKILANKPIIIKGGTQSLEALAGGQGAIAVGGYGGRAEQFRSEGAPVDWARVGPVPAMIYTHMALKGAPHPNASILWAAWSIGREHLAALYARQRFGRLTGPNISPLGKAMKDAGLDVVVESTDSAEMQRLLVKAGAMISGAK